VKRSEALQLIKDSLQEIDMNANTPLFAEEILKKLEKAGMEPPINDEKSFTLLPSGELTYAVHEWEAE